MAKWKGVWGNTQIIRPYLLNLFVYNDANSMLGNIVDSPGFAMVTFVGHSFLNSTHSLLERKSMLCQPLPPSF